MSKQNDVKEQNAFLGQGWEDFDQLAPQIEEDIKENEAKRIYRHWLAPENDAILVFLDGKPPIVSEHQVQINGDWKNWFTCTTATHGRCPLCESGSKPETVGFFTVIDMKPFVTTAGEERVNTRRLLPAKYSLLKKLRLMLQEHGDLRGCVFNVTRTSSKAVNTGDKWEFVRRMTEEELATLNENVEPADYQSILAVKSPEEIEKALAAPPVQNRNTGAGSFKAKDEDIDF